MFSQAGTLYPKPDTLHLILPILIFFELTIEKFTHFLDDAIRVNVVHVHQVFRIAVGTEGVGNAELGEGAAFAAGGNDICDSRAQAVDDIVIFHGNDSARIN
jgi:hypothetical protein